MFLFFKTQVRKNFTPIIFFFVIFIIYLHNLSSASFAGDAGDFLAAIVVKGVPHPSGYPLFVLLGIIFNFLPFGHTVAWRVDLISALFASLAVVLMYLISSSLVKSRLIAVLTALTLAFFYPFWLYAEVAEVFSLAYFFVLLLFYMSIRYSKTKNTKILYLISFFVGLSLSNHEIIIMIFPSIALLILWSNLKIIKISTIFTCFGCVLLGLLPYIYIPIAAFHSPQLNWGEATSVQNFINIITRHDYGWTSKLPIEHVLMPLDAYRKYFFSELPLILMLILPLGLIGAIKNRQFLIGFSIVLNIIILGPLFLLLGGAAITNNFVYGIFERFYVFSFLFLIMLLPLSVDFISNFVINFLANFVGKKFLSKIKLIVVIILLIIPFSLFFHNMPRTDFHNLNYGDDFVFDSLSSIPEKSMVFIAGDTLFFNSLYYQNVYKLNGRNINNINIVTAGGLNNYIDGNKVLKAKKESLLKQHKDLSRNDANLTTIFSYPDNLNIFTNAEEIIDPKYAKKIIFMPYGLVFKIAGKKERQLTKDEFLKLQEELWEKLKLTPEVFGQSEVSLGFHMLDIQQRYAKGAAAIGDYLLFHYDDVKASKNWYEKSLKYYPEEGGFQGLGYYYYVKNNCSLAKYNLDQVIFMNSNNKLAYKQMYLIYKNCYKNNKKADEIKKLIKNVYNVNIK